MSELSDRQKYRLWDWLDDHREGIASGKFKTLGVLAVAADNGLPFEVDAETVLHGLDVLSICVTVHGPICFPTDDTEERSNSGRITDLAGRVSALERTVSNLTESRLESLHQPQDSQSGMSAIIGKWPGDETDEEIADGLASL